MGETVDLPPIPGKAVDPLGKSWAALEEFIDERSTTGGILFQVWHRFLESRLTLLAAGATYYVFLSLVSLIAFAYGSIALLGADELSHWLTDTLNEAFPGLIGANGISPESIRDYGTAASIVGLIFLGYAGTASLYAINRSLHLIFGAPKDPRNFVLNRIRMFGLLVVLGPVILLSFVPSIVSTALAGPLERLFGLDPDSITTFVVFISTLLSTAMNFLVIYTLFSLLGGIRPSRRSRAIGALAGAVSMEVLKFASAYIVAWSLSKPQYGAFAAPITALLMLYLLNMVVFTSACLTAGIALKWAKRPDA